MLTTRSIALDTEASAPGASGRTVVIMNGGGPMTPGQHLPLFNPPANGNPSAGNPQQR